MTFKRTIAFAAVLLFTLLITEFASRSERVEPKRSFDDFPRTIGKWQGRKQRFDPEIYNILGVDDSVLMNFSSPDNRHVNLYVGFYQSQKEGDLIHSPKNCMPGAGWNIVDTRIETVGLADPRNPRKVIFLELKKGSEKQLMLYWFQSRGRIISSEYWQKIWLVIDSITKRRTDGSFVRLISPVTGSEAQTLETLKAFARRIYPYLNEYIPS